MYNQAFTQWKTFHENLVRSIGDYIDACDTLEIVLARPPQSSGDKSMLEDVLTLISVEIPSLSSCKDKLHNSWSCLARIRNRSARLAPVNLLPPELLGDIFMIASPPSHLCIQHVASEFITPSPTPIDSITGVCRRWRNIAIQTPMLWSHIDLIAAGRWTNRFKWRAQHHIERAGSVPVEMHIQDTSNSSLSAPDEANILDIVAFLTPYARQCRSLELLLESHTRDLPRLTLLCLAVHGTPSILDTLHLSGQLDDQQAPLDYSALPASHDLDRLLAPVRTLHLRRMTIDWFSAAYYDLIDLAITHLPEVLWPTTHQMIVVLSACPKLRRLKLEYVGISGASSAVDLPPTFMGELEELNLLHLRSSCVTVLSLISPGSKPLSASIILDGSAGEDRIVCAFFKSSHLVTLFVSDIRQRRTEWVSQTLGTLPHLEMLALDNSRLAIDSSSSTVERWPRLRTIYMIDSYFTSRSIFLVLAANSIEILSLWRCRVTPPRFPEDENGIHTMEQLQAALFDSAPRLDCFQKIVSCPPRSWPCVL
jgi:hypothetical protein